MASPTQPFELGIGPISCHCFNRDQTQVAVSPNNHEVHILTWGSGKWQSTHVLQDHDMAVTSIDWAPKTNRIVTCSQDKNAFVYTLDERTKQWMPELVLARSNRSATCVKWSPQENKFALGSGAKTISICYYEKENTWWVAKQIKKPIDSTVTSVDWHPNNVLLAVGCCDFKARVFSAFIKDVDSTPAPTQWGNKNKFGDLIMAQSNGGGGWVHSVAFSPSGSRLAWVGHDSSVSVVDASQADSITTIKEWFLPFTKLIWVSENSIVAAGHDCTPMLFSYTGPNQLKFVSKLDVPSEQKAANESARAMFRNLDKLNSSVTDTGLKTLHQNRITGICAHTTGANKDVSKFSTVGIDGLMVLWDLRTLEQRVASIKVS